VLKPSPSFAGDSFAGEQAEVIYRRLALLSRASEILASSLDYEATLRQVAWLVVPELGDWCAIYLTQADGSPRFGALAYAKPGHMRLAQAFERVRPLLPTRAQHVLRSDGSKILPEINCRARTPVVADRQTVDQLQSMGLQSLVQLPMRTRGRTFGVLTLVAVDPARHFGPADVALAQQVADRCAVAIDNATLVGELRQALGVREELLAATSHELRTPLAHIKGFTSTLRQSDVEWDEATRQDFLAEIEREADRLAELIDDLLSMSRLESGTPAQHLREAAAPADVVTAGLDRIRGLLGEARVEVDVAPDLPAVTVDAAQMEQVVANLVENAAKYGPATVQIRVTAARAGDDLELGVEDNGPGIPEEDLEHVFDKFYRARRTEQSGVPGTGLGLAICRAIVEAHGGRIWAENRPHGGARLVVRLPIHPLAGRDMQ
jgi:K+-sensing histidine kinase KdpD